jgi:hypothetical protein
VLSLTFSPLIAWSLLAPILVVATGLALWLLLSLRFRAWPRVLALLALSMALLDPTLLGTEQKPLRDIALLISDETGSNRLGERPRQTRETIASLEQSLQARDVEIRKVTLTDAPDDGGTRLFEAMRRALADIPASRLSGILAVTDGMVHDLVDTNLPGPFHALITGSEQERDRAVHLLSTPRFGLVGKEQTIRAEIRERGGTGEARVIIRQDGQVLKTQNVPTNIPFPIPIKIEHGGQILIEIEAELLPNELTLANNRAFLALEGIRESLKVLLVSGEPHAGERTWRNLLKSDAYVDLVHFTILRPPEKQDGTPINELSLIAFPTRELFQVKIAEFDLIIFDRYANQSVLPSSYYDSIVRYVREGGAVLLASGPELVGAGSLARTRLAPILPALPDGRMMEEPFRPSLPLIGQRHPVTRDLPGAAQIPSDWGEWLRVVSASARSGHTVMNGPSGTPLLVLAREGKGRVALLLSDHVWLWARGYRGGGPHRDLLRSLAHWLMKEPALEEESLQARVNDNMLTVTRQSLAETSPLATIAFPDGSERPLDLTLGKPGLFQTALTSTQQGVHILKSNDLTAFANIGPANPKEISEIFSDTARLTPVAQATGGSVRRIEAGLPALSLVKGPIRNAALSSEEIRLRAMGASLVTGIRSLPLGLGLAGLFLLGGIVFAVWLGEGLSRKRRA